MARLKALLIKAVDMILQGSTIVCTACGNKVPSAQVCECCGAIACCECQSEGSCPNCGEPV
jgi:hypothetical protein